MFIFRCEKEYLEFRDGAARFSKLINHICGRNEVQDVETTENFLYIKFFTDLSVPNNGFKLNVTIGIHFYNIYIYIYYIMVMLIFMEDSS